MNKRRIALNQNDFPAPIWDLLQNANVFDSSGRSNAQVLFCDKGYYIKIDAKGELAREAALGKQFYAWGLGVEVVSYLSLDRDYLVTRSAVGEDLTHCLEKPEQLCELLAGALQRLHSLPLDNVPVSSRQQRYLESAAGDLNGGYYDPSVLMEGFRIESKREAWEIMQANQGRLRQDTLIHGDACLPNVICRNGTFSAFIDLSMAGAGDRHIDLYWALWSLQYNLGTERFAERFLDAYGREHVDMDMLRVVAAFELFG